MLPANLRVIHHETREALAASDAAAIASGTATLEAALLGTPMVIVLPLTTQVYPSFKRWRITIAPRDRLLKPCQVVVDQPRALDLDRFGDGPLTTLAPEEMAEVEKSLKGVLGLL